MILISHRGNINGRIESYENEPNYIDLAIKDGYDVEVDIWLVDGIIYLGHDEPQHGINFRWIRDRINKLWIHCKNIDALVYFNNIEYDIKYFWHQEDDVTLTNTNKLWTYPGRRLTKLSIAVLPEQVEYTEAELEGCYGICSDYIIKYI